MGQTVPIPKGEYDFLIKCKRVLELENDKKFTPEFLKKLEKAKGDIKQGKGLRFKTKEEVEKYFMAK